MNANDPDEDTVQTTLNSPTDDSPTSDTKYRIQLLDIAGVGETTQAKLNRLGINSVARLHLVRPHRSTTRARADRENITIQADTWEHLEAVGQAVHSNRKTVEARHLTASFAQRDGSKHVDIMSHDTDFNSKSHDQDPPFPQPAHHLDENILDSILDTIYNEYGDSMPEQNRFQADLGRFARDSWHHDNFPEFDHGLIKVTLIYQHPADTVQAQDQFSPAHGLFLKTFAENKLSWPPQSKSDS